MTYCPKCGKQVDDGSAYCPGCGAALSNSSGGQNYNQNYYQDNNQNNNQNWTNNYGPGPNINNNATKAPGSLNNVVVLGFIWIFVSIIMAIYFFTINSTFFFFYSSMLNTIGALYILGAFLTLISCLLIIKRSQHIWAVIFCVIASVIALFTGGIIIGIIGLLFARNINNAKYMFTS